MLKIGVCGSSGSGKGYICSMFQKFGAVHIDTDKVYSEIAVPGSDPFATSCLDKEERYIGLTLLSLPAAKKSLVNLDR